MFSDVYCVLEDTVKLQMCVLELDHFTESQRADLFCFALTSILTFILNDSFCSSHPNKNYLTIYLHIR